VPSACSIQRADCYRNNLYLKRVPYSHLAAAAGKRWDSSASRYEGHANPFPAATEDRSKPAFSPPHGDYSQTRFPNASEPDREKLAIGRNSFLRASLYLVEGACLLHQALRSIAWCIKGVEMRATFQSTSDRLRRLEKDNVELAANFAELEELREQVRQEQALSNAKRPRLAAPAKFLNPSSGFRTAG
jgi:hypothetical protein